MGFLMLISTAVVTAATLAAGIGAGYVLMRIMLAVIERMFRSAEASGDVIQFVARTSEDQPRRLQRAA